MKHYCKILTISVLIVFSFNVSAQFSQPFKWNAVSNGSELTVSVEIPASHYLYADKRTRVTVAGLKLNLQPEFSPETIKHTDDFGSGEIFPAGKQTWTYKIKPEETYKVNIEFQGCKEKTKDSPGICFMPSEADFSVHFSPKSNSIVIPDLPINSSPSLAARDDSLNALLDQFEVVNTGGGYLNKEEFLTLLEKNQTLNKFDIAYSLAGKGNLGIILLVLLGGIALNLTPCVLPMIPVNLTIIGAGNVAGDKRQGFIRGGAYGAGIAIAYGLLGLITVLSGAKFGTLNSSALFNFLVASVFVILALALFDIFSIDFTRFSAKIGIKKPETGALVPIFFMGVVAALLAGACVAPVVIAVLIHSISLYNEGNFAGLILPFVLGIGMALPWPFAGAGMASIPKPGKWMVRVKQAMGVMIFLFAVYYVYTGITLIPRGEKIASESPFAVLKKGLLQAKRENKPVFIDFWASWCKNCVQMERTTFKDPEVISKLNSYVTVKFQAEQPGEPKNKKLLDRFKLIGLPGYVILKPKANH